MLEPKTLCGHAPNPCSDPRDRKKQEKDHARKAVGLEIERKKQEEEEAKRVAEEEEKRKREEEKKIREAGKQAHKKARKQLRLLCEADGERCGSQGLQAVVPQGSEGVVQTEALHWGLRRSAWRGRRRGSCCCAKHTVSACGVDNEGLQRDSGCRHRLFLGVVV